VLAYLDEPNQYGLHEKFPNGSADGIHTAPLEEFAAPDIEAMAIIEPPFPEAIMCFPTYTKG